MEFIIFFHFQREALRRRHSSSPLGSTGSTGSGSSHESFQSKDDLNSPNETSNKHFSDESNEGKTDQSRCCFHLLMISCFLQKTTKLPAFAANLMLVDPWSNALRVRLGYTSSVPRWAERRFQNFGTAANAEAPPQSTTVQSSATKGGEKERSQCGTQATRKSNKCNISGTFCDDSTHRSFKNLLAFRLPFISNLIYSKKTGSFHHSSEFYKERPTNFICLLYFESLWSLWSALKIILWSSSYIAYKSLSIYKRGISKKYWVLLWRVILPSQYLVTQIFCISVRKWLWSNVPEHFENATFFAWYFVKLYVNFIPEED